jgi:hypothetical protein
MFVAMFLLCYDKYRKTKTYMAISQNRGKNGTKEWRL